MAQSRYAPSDITRGTLMPGTSFVQAVMAAKFDPWGQTETPIGDRTGSGSRSTGRGIAPRPVRSGRWPQRQSENLFLFSIPTWRRDGAISPACRSLLRLQRADVFDDRRELRVTEGFAAQMSTASRI